MALFPKVQEQLAEFEVVLINVTVSGTHPTVSTPIKPTAGRGFTVTEAVSVAVHPFASATVMVYTVLEVGETLAADAFPPEGAQA